MKLVLANHSEYILWLKPWVTNQLEFSIHTPCSYPPTNIILTSHMSITWQSSLAVTQGGPMTIKKYSSTSNVGIGQIQYGAFYIRFRSSSTINTAEWCKVLIDRNTLLLYCKIYSQSSANLSHRWEKFTIKILILALLFSFFFFLTHKWKKHRVHTYKRSPYQLTSLLLEMFLSWLDLHARPLVS